MPYQVSIGPPIGALTVEEAVALSTYTFGLLQAQGIYRLPTAADYGVITQLCDDERNAACWPFVSGKNCMSGNAVSSWPAGYTAPWAGRTTCIASNGASYPFGMDTLEDAISACLEQTPYQCSGILSFGGLGGTGDCFVPRVAGGGPWDNAADTWCNT